MCVRGQRPLDTVRMSASLSLSLAQYGTRSGPDRTKVLRFCLMTRGDPPPRGGSLLLLLLLERQRFAGGACNCKSLSVVEVSFPSWTGVRAAVVDPIDAGEAINRLETQRN